MAGEVPVVVNDVNSWFAWASTMFDEGRFEEMVERLSPVAAGHNDARLYQMLGLAQRELLASAPAIAAFEQAALLAPADVRIAHALARSTLEAGQPATALYRRALTLSPNDAGLLIGEAAALSAEGRGLEAEARLRQLLREHPGWYDGHATFARMVGTTGLGSEGTSTVREAVARFPQDPALRQLLLRLLLDEGRYADVLVEAAAASAAAGASPEWIRAEAIALGETGRAEEAQRLFERLPVTRAGNGLVQRIRNLIRLQRMAEATAIAELTPDDGDHGVLWPYRALLWRLAGDPRWEWLEGDPRLIGTYDLALPPAVLERLSQVLRGLHGRSGLLPDQSVRRGTQTDGNLLARSEPELLALRQALLAAVATHVAQLPPPVAGHPSLIRDRHPLRISGSWSVRLTDSGFHVDHVHPHGWLSSAFYVALPEGGKGLEDGWLAFGENRALLPDVAGFRVVEPRVGRLVLFPSTMWHGTRPFAAGERMTVAFDIVRPRTS